MKKILICLMTMLTMAIMNVKAATTTIWSGNFNVENWSNVLDLEGSKFSLLQPGDKVIFKGSVSGEAQIQIANQNWSEYIPSNQYNCGPFNDNYSISITNSNLSFFKGGIHVKGQQFTLTEVCIEGNDGGSSSGGNTGGDTQPTPTGSFYVKGTQLIDAKGNEFIMRGCNYSYAWQKGNENRVIPAAKRIGCNAIRINISNGKKFTYCSKSEVANLIKLCEDNHLVCVLCVHDPLGSNNISDLDQAVDYWVSIKDLIIGHESTVIVNIANEWVAAWDSGCSVWQEGYMKAVKNLRAAGFKNTLMVDCAGYGQYPAVIGTHGKAVFEADPMKNLMFSIHMYQYDAGTPDQVRSNIDQALAINVPLCIGEFAYNHQGAEVAYQTIMDYCQQKSVGYLVWSWTGNSGGAEACDMFGGYDENDVKENGRVTVWGKNGIKETSKECTIYDKNVSTIDNDVMNEVPEFDFTRPYTTYDFSGRLVKKVTVPGIYILRQGLASIKIRKN